MGLALLMTAGVAGCGGQTSGTSTGKADGATKDSGNPCAQPGHCAIEAAQMVDSGHHGSGSGSGPTIEAASFEGGVVEGPPPFEGGVVEAAQIDGGATDAHRGFDGPAIEAASIEGGAPGH